MNNTCNCFLICDLKRRNLNKWNQQLHQEMIKVIMLIRIAINNDYFDDIFYVINVWLREEILAIRSLLP